ncbi:MAG: hypothetical protein AAF598_01745 [Bacteroidota bacterium]
MKDSISPDHLIPLINQIHDLKVKVNRKLSERSVHRNFDRIFRQFETYGLFYQDPTGEAYSETRTDCDATISGNGSQPLTITEVIKPLVFEKQGDLNQILQKAVVIVNG